MYKNIPALTGIRGIAAMLITIFHLPLKAMFHLEEEPLIIRHGFMAVDLFFILSGFILMHVHADQLRVLTLGKVRDFYISRFLRVYPLHVLVLLMILGFIMLMPPYAVWFRTVGGQELAYSWAGFFQTLTLTNSLGLAPLGAWNPPTWSLSVELVGYLFFPLIAAIAGRIDRVKICWGAAALTLVLFSLNGHSIRLGGGLGRMACCFTAGIVLARAYHLRSTRVDGRLLGYLSAGWSITAMATDDWATESVFGFAGLIYALALGGGAIAKFLSSAPLLFLGRISFSLYLCHYVIQSALLWAFWQAGASTPHPVLTTLILVGISTGGATILHYMVEQPIHDFSRRVTGRRKGIAEEAGPLNVPASVPVTAG